MDAEAKVVRRHRVAFALGNMRRYTDNSGTNIVYAVDGRNRRIAKLNGATGALMAGYLYEGNCIIATVDQNDNLNAHFVYVTKPNVPDIMVTWNGSAWAAYRIISDRIGSVRIIVDPNGNVLEGPFFYDTWGVSSAWPTTVPFGWAGGLWDGTNGLCRMGARDYNPWVGRCWSKDPIGFGGGRDLYAYCANDPANCIDPEGLRPYVDSYLTPTGAAYSALSDIAELPPDQRNATEWGGWLYQNQDGRYGYTLPGRGDVNRTGISYPLPAADFCSPGTPVGTYHSHLLGHMNGPSPVDRTTAFWNEFFYDSWYSYVSGPDGSFYRYNFNGIMWAIPQVFPYFEIE